MSATIDTHSSAGNHGDHHSGDHHGGDQHGDGHGEHGHMRFLAHHFDDPEQQFDAGKLGIWLFLVTEVLFFSGMFCAYALYRSLHPEVFTFASQFLNETLGAFNTGVLLFSSLTMAWGVRCAQLRQRTGLVVALAMTLGCASIFLGVKAVEYSHKWDIGLLPAGLYQSQFKHVVEHHEGEISNWLYRFSYLPAAAAIGLGIWYGLSLSRKDKASSEIAGPFFVTALCYFVGVGIGLFFQAQEANHNAAKDGHGQHVSANVAGHGSATHESLTEVSDARLAIASPEAHNQPATHASHTETGSASDKVSQPGMYTDREVDQQGRAGLFFSIYYCMTGVHALHIIGGIAVLGWLLVRATKDHFNEQYFGPVDYVGLYWHIVDLIWIFLFPLLYLIK